MKSHYYATASISSNGDGIARVHKTSSNEYRSKWRAASSLFALAASVGDLGLWIFIYFGITLLSGSYNAITYDAVIIPILVLMFSIALVGGYKIRTDFASLRYSSEHLIACSAAYPFAAFFQYVVASFGSGMGSSRAIFSASLVCFAICALVLRRLFWFSTSQSRARGKLIAIVDEQYGPQFYVDYLRSGQHQLLRCFACDKSLIGKRIAGEGSPIIRYSIDKILPLLDRDHAGNYEGIVIAARFSKLDPAIMSRLGVIHFENLPVHSLESFYENFWSRIMLGVVGLGWPLETNFLLVQNSVYSAIKRLVDVVISLSALILLSPVMLLVSLAILIFDGAPIIYSQKRVGINERLFSIYKFRSMRSGSDQGDRYTHEGDSRVTTIGKFLRKTRLDELPQLWNVLIGDMSMIGPRAEWVKLVEDYEKQIDYYHFRHLVRPGITGWAQVNYPYGACLDDTLQKLSYDLYYIRHFSLRLDAEVTLKTLHVMVFGKGQ